MASSAPSPRLVPNIAFAGSLLHGHLVPPLQLGYSTMSSGTSSGAFDLSTGSGCDDEKLQCGCSGTRGRAVPGSAFARHVPLLVCQRAVPASPRQSVFSRDAYCAAPPGADRPDFFHCMFMLASCYMVSGPL